MLSYRVCPLPSEPVTGWKRLFWQFVGGILPKNDPDFFLPTETVAYWWLELEGLEGRREIGFNSQHGVVQFAPIARNRGLFVGETLASRHLTDRLTAEEFNEAWARALRTWPEVARKGAA